MGLVCMVPPSLEPVTLAEAKAFLRIEDSTEDQVVTDLITAARQYVENRTGRALITQTWQLTDDGFPSLWWKTIQNTAFRRTPQILGMPIPVWPANPMALTAAQEIAIPMPPLQSVVSVQYVDTNGNMQLLPPTQYQVDNTDVVGRLAPSVGNVWPITQIGQYNAASVIFKAGYGDAETDVPLALRRVIRALVGVFYATRELTTPVTQKVVPVGGVDSVIQQYRAQWVF
jgi:uncharacterized phiE125 gp8 family phage protein